VGETVSDSDGRLATRRLGAIAVLLAASVALSRVLGYAREAVIAWRLGVSVEVDAYRAAFLLPDILNHLLAGGALSIAFIPLYRRALREQGREGAARLLAVVLGTTTALAAVATLLLWIFAEPLLAGLFGFSGEKLALTVSLTRILLPAQIFFVAGGVVRGASMAHGRFVSQALSGVLYNLAIIAGGLLLAGRYGAEGFAWGALVGAFAGAYLTAWVEARHAPEIDLGWRFSLRDAGLHRYLWIALPLMLGLSLLTVDEWLYRVFGGRLADGVIAALGYARMLLQLPVAVVGQAVATAALPFLARLYAEGRHAELERVLLQTLQAGVALALLMAAGLLALAQPIVAVLYERGQFSAQDTALVAHLLRLYAFSAPAWVAQQIAVRAFYARDDTWRPMLLGTAVTVPVVGLYAVLTDRFGADGIVVASVIGMTVNALATLTWARRLHGAPALGALALSALRAMLASALAAGATWLALAQWRGFSSALADLLLGGAVFGVAGLAAAWLLGDAALRDALARPVARALRRRK
jgi:putative peptidoglycan lipid II flippase